MGVVSNMEEFVIEIIRVCNLHQLPSQQGGMPTLTEVPKTFAVIKASMHCMQVPVTPFDLLFLEQITQLLVIPETVAVCAGLDRQYSSHARQCH